MKKLLLLLSLAAAMPMAMDAHSFTDYWMKSSAVFGILTTWIFPGPVLTGMLVGGVWGAKVEMLRHGMRALEEKLDASYVVGEHSQYPPLPSLSDVKPRHVLRHAYLGALVGVAVSAFCCSAKSLHDNYVKKVDEQSTK
jgi:hypothetical protein